MKEKQITTAITSKRMENNNFFHINKETLIFAPRKVKSVRNESFNLRSNATSMWYLVRILIHGPLCENHCFGRQVCAFSFCYYAQA